MSNGKIPLERPCEERISRRTEREEDVARHGEGNGEPTFDFGHRQGPIDDRRHAGVDDHTDAEAVARIPC